MAHLKSRTQTPALVTSSPLEAAYPPLPAPHNFDILPPLHALLSRLEPSLNTYTPDSADSSATVGNNGAQGQLSYKDAAVAAQFLKTRIRKTLTELGALADMDRTVTQQQEEIAKLEDKIRTQKEVLSKLGQAADDMLKGLVVKDQDTAVGG